MVCARLPRLSLWDESKKCVSVQLDEYGLFVEVMYRGIVLGRIDTDDAANALIFKEIDRICERITGIVIYEMN